MCISTYFPEHGGGVERVAHDLAQWFSTEEGWHILMAAHETQGQHASSGEAYDRYPIRCWNGIENVTGLPVILPHPADILGLLRRMSGYDVVMVHEEIYFANFIAMVWALVRGKTLVMVKHTGRVPLKNPVLNGLLLGITRYISKPLIKRAARTVFVTHAKQENYDAAGVLRNAVVITNGIDTDRFALPSENAPPRDGVLFVGRFVESKGMGVVRRISEAMPDTSFTLVGWGPVDPKKWGLANVAVVVKPERQEMARLMRQAQVALVPSETEGLPLVALEAMACGTRTIVNEGMVGVNETIGSELVYAKTDLADIENTSTRWIAALQRTLAQKDTLNLQKARRAAVIEKNSIAAMSKAYAEIVREAVAGRAATNMDT